MNIEQLFETYISEPSPEHWQGFPELMWELGFEMDCYHSAPDLEEFEVPGDRADEAVQDKLLEKMEGWSTQNVGNYIFSRYRELTHWCDYGYPESRGAYFFRKAFSILIKKLMINEKE